MKLEWDKVGERLFETGVNKTVLYPQDSNGEYPKGYAWSGITAINEQPSGAEATALYADNIKYLNLISAEEFKATVEAYMYPDAFKPCNGEKEIAPGVYVAQQTRQHFGMSYQTLIGNDIEDSAHGYKIHLVYGCAAAASEKSYSTVNDSPEAGTFSWEVSTTPVDVPNMKPTALLTIDSTAVDKTKLAKLEEVLYGTDSAEARLPLPKEIAEILKGEIAG